jgi:hypothetical protein
VGRTGAALGPGRRTDAHGRTYAFDQKDTPPADLRAAVLGRELGRGLGQPSILGDVVLERVSVANERQLLACCIELVLFGDRVRHWCQTRRTCGNLSTSAACTAPTARSSQTPGTSSATGRPRATGGARPTGEILTDVTVDREGWSRCFGGGCEEASQTRAHETRPPGAPARASGQSSLSLSPRRRAVGLVGRLCSDHSTTTRMGLLLVLCHACPASARSALFPLFTPVLAVPSNTAALPSNLLG